ncbi:uncharacterized protein LOC143219390 [Lasioglossum baleicum]|uniref:uncharacterized protein LOC143219390 n=1 Tax=Lasioglossum baleicum TaxID=434251 RepID=UPI003FCDE946
MESASSSQPTEQTVSSRAPKGRSSAKRLRCSTKRYSRRKLQRNRRQQLAKLATEKHCTAAENAVPVSSALEEEMVWDTNIENFMAVPKGIEEVTCDVQAETATDEEEYFVVEEIIFDAQAETATDEEEHFVVEEVTCDVQAETATDEVEMVCDANTENFMAESIRNKEVTCDVQAETATDEEEHFVVEEVTCDVQAETATDEEEYFVVEKETTTEPEEVSSLSEGLSIADMRHVFHQVQEASEHSKKYGCTTKNLQIEKMFRSALETTMVLKCTMCDHRANVRSQRGDTKAMNINHGVVAGTITTGGGYAQAEEFLAALNIPMMSKKKYQSCHDVVVLKVIAAAEKVMLAAAAEEIRLAIERGDVINGIPHIPVVCDGTWMKRSYRTGKYDSIAGVGVIIGYYTKKVLFVGVRNKDCSICREASKKDQEPREHECFKNWSRNETSTKMESDAIAEGFRTSIEKRGLIYSTIIGDGDSSVYKTILDCDPYKTLVRVKKIECTNHLLRNFCNKMKEIVKKTPAGYYRRIVEACIRRMRTGIVKAAEHRANEDLPLAEKIRKLYEDITNVPSHVFGEHKRCNEIRYFCDGTPKEDEENIVPDLTNIGVYQQIEDIIGRLAAHAESLLYLTNNNMVESFNSIIPKYTGGKRLHFGQRGSYTARCHAAVIQYNTKDVLSCLQREFQNEPPKVLLKMEERRRKRVLANNQRQRTTKRTCNKFRATKDADYGPNAQAPDMEEPIYILARENHLKMLSDWQKDRDNVQRNTVGQWKSAEWLMKKSKLLTASNFGVVCSRLKGTLCKKLVENLLYPRKLDENLAIRYGRKYEHTAREELASREGITIEECGLFIDASIPYLGASPDGLIDDDGIVEIKCPYTAENVTPEEAIQSVQAVKTMFTDSTGTALRKTHRYFYQVQGQLHITGRKYCIFCVWTRKGIKSIRVDRDDDFWKLQMEPKLSRFYLNCMLPELVDPRRHRRRPIREPQYLLDEHAELMRKRVATVRRRVARTRARPPP